MRQNVALSAYSKNKNAPKQRDVAVPEHYTIAVSVYRVTMIFTEVYSKVRSSAKPVISRTLIMSSFTFFTTISP